jgi:hypothetical protein
MDRKACLVIPLLGTFSTVAYSHSPFGHVNFICYLIHLWKLLGIEPMDMTASVSKTSFNSNSA